MLGQSSTARSARASRFTILAAAQRRVQEGQLDTIYQLTLAAEYKDHDAAGHIEGIGRIIVAAPRAPTS